MYLTDRHYKTAGLTHQAFTFFPVYIMQMD